MVVSQLIERLNNTVSELNKLDPNLTVEGYIPYPSEGYSGDMEGPITRLEVQHVKENMEYGRPEHVVIGVHYITADW
jgi:hypothetical protein